MDIPAKLVVEKMEHELAQLKASLEGSGSDHRNHAQALKTYCDLLLDSRHTGTYYKAEAVQHASVSDVRPAPEKTAAPKAQPQENKKPDTIYDEGNEPKSDSLFDF
ncbi:YwdI family protein [Alkalicoccus urumqiensis]|nr:YwdI family protein [Alkalicoccus urumqiensis]